MARRPIQLDPLGRSLRMIEEALNAGTHSARAERVCDRCREFRRMYHSTIDRKPLCLPCAAALGINGAAEHLAAQREKR